jgi:predicted nucleotidyltransferase
VAQAVGFGGRGAGSSGRGGRRQRAPFFESEQPAGSSSGAATAGLIPRERIQAYCDAVAREFRARKIVLFGSYAYGQPTPDSDVDLLVVLPFRGNAVAKAIQIRARFDTPFPLDLLARTPEFVAARLRERDMFIELVMSQGLVMYESQHP